MAALPEGAQAPDFSLLDADGIPFNLHESLEDGRVLLTFYKTSCPTCQYALPFLDRFGDLLNGAAAASITVSQDSLAEAERFSVEFGYTTRQVFDTEGSGFPVSNAYGLTNVPTVFLVGQSGRIEHSMVSWSKSDVEALARKLGVESPFRRGESVLPYKPG